LRSHLPPGGFHLLAIDPVRLDRYHIESGVSVSASYRALTAKPFDPLHPKERVKIAGSRRTLGAASLQRSATYAESTSDWHPPPMSSCS
jgi:hypothetical protein